jgi:hypothetical protein
MRWFTALDRTRRCPFGLGTEARAALEQLRNPRGRRSEVASSESEGCGRSSDLPASHFAPALCRASTFCVELCGQRRRSHGDANPALLQGSGVGADHVAVATGICERGTSGLRSGPTRPSPMARRSVPPRKRLRQTRPRMGWRGNPARTSDTMIHFAPHENKNAEGLTLFFEHRFDASTRRQCYWVVDVVPGRPPD